MINLVGATVIEKDYSSVKNCEGGTCTLTLYSGTQFAKNNNGEWVDWQQAESLKDNGFEVVYIEKDERYGLEVLDFNATSIKVKLNPKGFTVFPYSTDLKILDKDSKEKKTSKKEFNLLTQTIEETLDFNLVEGEMLKFGDNSTMIILNTANSENLEDTYISEISPATNYGTSSYLFSLTSLPVVTYRHVNTLLKFNITKLPSNIVINNANLSLYVDANFYDAGEAANVSTHRILQNSSGWIEETISWANFSLSYEDSYSDLRVINNSFVGTNWITWNVTSIISSDLGYNTTSIYVKSRDELIGTPGDGDGIRFSSKDTATNTRPKLTIVYSNSTAQTNCTAYSGSGNYDLDCSTNCHINTTTDLGRNNFSFMGNGVVYLDANVTNFDHGYIGNYCKPICRNGGCFIT